MLKQTLLIPVMWKTLKSLVEHGSYLYLQISVQVLFAYLLTYFMEQSPSWEANRFAASQEIHRILWNPKVHYRIHKCTPPVSILNQFNPVLILFSHLRLRLPSGLFPWGFPTKILYTPSPPPPPPPHLSELRALSISTPLLPRPLLGANKHSRIKSLNKFNNCCINSVWTCFVLCYIWNVFFINVTWCRFSVELKMLFNLQKYPNDLSDNVLDHTVPLIYRINP
jgi:hypothetical protein